jgi:hypothetical protein
MDKYETVWLEVLTDEAANRVRLRVRGRSMTPTLRPGDVIVAEPISAAHLRPGDWVVLRTSMGPVVHRLLRITPDGHLLTKGDGHRAPDPLWAEEAVWGRVVEFEREGHTPAPIDPTTLRERGRTVLHRLVAWAWKGKDVLLPLVLALLLVVSPTLASVDFLEDSFQATYTGEYVQVSWETASEVDTFGFWLYRSTEPDGALDQLTDDIIPAENSIVGAYYTYEDYDVEAGTTYYYTIEVWDDSDQSEYGPISVDVPAQGTTPTPTNTPTNTPTPTPTPTLEPGAPTPTPEPYARFWASETSLGAGECTTLQWQTENIREVYLDGEGVPGYSATSVCPCEDESHVLRVIYQDNSYEDLVVDLSVTGSCGTSSPTSTPRPATATPPPATPRPTATPRPPTPTRTPTPLAQPGATLEVDATSTPTPTPTSSPTATRAEPESLTPLPSPEPEAEEGIGASVPTPTPPRPQVQGVNAGAPQNDGWLWLGLTLGAGLLGVGGWGLWKGREGEK